MSLYSNDIKEIKKCSMCNRNMESNRIMLKYKGTYVCDFCYQNEILYKKEQEQMTNLKEQMQKERKNIESVTKEFSFFSENYTFPKGKRDIKMNPKNIVEYLNQYVIGQESAKKSLAVAAYNHYLRINAPGKGYPKANVIMQGSSGTGKTYLLKKIAEYLNVAFAVVDSSIITETGYVGADPEIIISILYQAADKNIERAQSGIVFLDEFDKLSSKYGHKDEKTSTGMGVQRQILKMVEGCNVDFSKSGNKRMSDRLTIDTTNILFICGGAFEEIKCKEEKKQKIGFETDLKTEIKETRTDKLLPDDFIRAGFLRELIGRLPVIVTLQDLSENDLMKILLDSKDSIIEKYQFMFKDEFDVELTFEKDAIAEIAHIAFLRNTGARALNAVVEEVVQRLVYVIPSDNTIKECIVTKQSIDGEMPVLLREEKLS